MAMVDFSNIRCDANEQMRHPIPSPISAVPVGYVDTITYNDVLRTDQDMMYIPFDAISLYK